ncbi:hypothetical protein CBR_g4035 [Chara braunii]|uniref:RING-type domain-containing protein n=1 Tax=Chara braunii TaxID=69332 RepID=A0A388KH19_CHABU|nr:hypothetical protein CBR_g4035 [Chara braunii]|eukprot:GBG69339.1 hypothetical protein CBR_g4035 [Chara braunii]
MPQRHSKNNNDLAFFTYDERRKLGYGTQKERLGKDSLKAFDACCLCLKAVIEPLCCQAGHIFCKECIYECLLAQKKDIKRKQALYQAQTLKDKELQAEREASERARVLEQFDRQNNRAVPGGAGKVQQSQHEQDTPSRFHGANSVKVTAYEEEALRTMKAFWLPSATPEAPQRVEKPVDHTVCPEGKEKLRLKDLFALRFDVVPNRESKTIELGGDRFRCPSCATVFTNSSTLVAIETCGHVLCSRCTSKFVVSDKMCCICSVPCKSRHLVQVQKGGTGFAAHGDTLNASALKLVGSGSGLGDSRPATKL